MDASSSDIVFTQSFRHEFGHFLDEMLGNCSLCDDFQGAIIADCYWYKNLADSIETKEIMLDRVVNTDAVDSHYLSDILSAFFQNEAAIIMAYESKNRDFYGHTESYWRDSGGAMRAISQECFANVFAILAENKPETVSVLKRFFPNMYGSVNRILHQKGNEKAT